MSLLTLLPRADPDRGREALRAAVQEGFAIQDHVPSYLRLSGDELSVKLEAAQRELEDCRACPRDCGVDRTAGEVGTCHTGRHAIVASAFPHFGEEDCLRGWNGSGTIFFSLCNLRCVFCQNWDISQQQSGQECDSGTVADLAIRLQEHGCHNINFVTPEHVVPQVVEAIIKARDRGLSVPVVYNTSAYDSIESLRLMEDLVDIYMPDFKFWSPELSARYLKAEDYPQAARAAILEMHQQVGPLQLDANGLARRGLLLRHLVMPGHVNDTREILRWVARELGPETYVNIMNQYHPAGRVDADHYPELDQRLSDREYRQAVASAGEIGLRNLDRRHTHPRLARRLHVL